MGGLIGGLIGKTLDNSPSLLGQSIPSFAVLFNAIAGQSNATIIAAPSIIAVDNVEQDAALRSSLTSNPGASRPDARARA